jgi:hypothetical protein
VKFGHHFQEYVKEFSGDKARTDSFTKTAQDFVSGEIEGFDHKSRINGLLYGEVQSGKTSHTFAAIAATADIDPGFNTFVYLSTDNVALQEQTYGRAISSLSTFQICSEADELRFRSVKVAQPTLIVLKKNAAVLSKWLATLRASERVRTSPLFIIDDEGDAAALNTKVNKDEESTIYGLISELRELGTSSIYLQVTATPQALFLQAEQENLKPMFAKYFEPGEGYLGGDFYYSDGNRHTNYFLDPDDIDEAVSGETLSSGLSHFVNVYLMTVAHLSERGWTNVNGLVHPAVSTKVQNQIARNIKEVIESRADHVKRESLVSGLESAYHDLKGSVRDLKSFQELSTLAFNLPINVSVMNSSAESERGKDYKEGFNIVVGANTLGRGVTFPHLQTVYYSRKTKQPQMDTAWQHSRIFGYDRDPDSVRLFMPVSLFRLFHVLQESNTLLRDAIQSGRLSDLQIIMAKGRARPTRTNVLRSSSYSLIVGGTNYFPAEPNQDNCHEIDRLLVDLPLGEVCEIGTDLAKKLVNLSSEIPGSWPAANFARAIDDLTSRHANIKVWLLTSLGRNLSAKTGTMLSEDDRRISSESFSDHFFLTAYRVTGGREKGWEGKPFWMINLRLPNSFVYHSVLS